MAEWRRVAVAVAVAAAALVVVVVVCFVPFLSHDRQVVAGTPGPKPLFTTAVVPIPGGQTLCVGAVTFDTNAQLAQFQLGSYGRPGPPLVVTAGAPGWSSTRRIAGFKDNQELSVPLRPPATAKIGRLCVTNRGQRKIAIYGTDEPRGASRERVTVGGRMVPTRVVLSLVERRRESVASRTPDVLRHIAALNPPVGRPLLWVLLALALVGMPAALLGALALAPQAEDREQERREEDLDADDHERRGEDRKALL